MGQVLISFLLGNQRMPSEIKPYLPACPVPAWDKKKKTSTLPVGSTNESYNISDTGIGWCCTPHREHQTKYDLALSSPGCDLISESSSVCLFLSCASVLMLLLSNRTPNVNADSYWESDSVLWPIRLMTGSKLWSCFPSESTAATTFSCHLLTQSFHPFALLLSGTSATDIKASLHFIDLTLSQSPSNSFFSHFKAFLVWMQHVTNSWVHGAINFQNWKSSCNSETSNFPENIRCFTHFVEHHIIS